MKETILKKTIGGYSIEVFHDCDGFSAVCEGKEFKHLNSIVRENYIKQFTTGKMDVFGVVRKKICDCCGYVQEDEEDSLLDIHAKDAEEAFKIYIKG